MSTVPETSTWTTGVYQLEEDDQVLGGATGVANQQAQDLASRTTWLKDHLAGTTGSFTWTEILQTTTGTWTCPAGVTKIFILEAVGAGGGGSGQFSTGSANCDAAGGGEGARIQGHWLTVVPGTAYTLTIGAGGTGGTGIIDPSPSWSSGVLGSDGGATQFGALLTLPGGKGGGSATPTRDVIKGSVPGLGGSVTIDGVIYRGQMGTPGHLYSSSEVLGLPPRGGGMMGGDWQMGIGAVAPGLGCGGHGGIYDTDGDDGTSHPDGQAGGNGLIRFGYFGVAISGNT